MALLTSPHHVSRKCVVSVAPSAFFGPGASSTAFEPRCSSLSLDAMETSLMKLREMHKKFNFSHVRHHALAKPLRATASPLCSQTLCPDASNPSAALFSSMLPSRRTMAT